MAPQILKGSREHCLLGLRNDEADLTEYPLRSYSDLEAFSLHGEMVRIFQGVNTVPQARFLVSMTDPAAAHAGMTVPGVVPFLVSTLQVSANRSAISPSPTDVGLPLLTTEDQFLIRWMFNRSGEARGNHTLWGRLSEEELESVAEEIRPDARIESDSRTVASYQTVSSAVAAPEPPDYVRARAGGLPHEPWLARSIELAEGWRVVIPNTSISCRPVVVPPQLTIIGQNFNVILCESANTAIAVGVVLSRSEPQGYLVGISPWSQGDTPRPRSKHVNSTLWMFGDHISALLADEGAALSRLSSHLELVWHLHLDAAISLARRAHAPGRRLRDVYTAIAPRECSDSVPVALLELDNRDLTVGLSEGRSLRISFDSAETAARAAVTIWTAIPQILSISDILDLRFDSTIPISPDAVRQVFFDEAWKRLVQTKSVTDSEEIP